MRRLRLGATKRRTCQRSELIGRLAVRKHLEARRQQRGLSALGRPQPVNQFKIQLPLRAPAADAFGNRGAELPIQTECLALQVFGFEPCRQCRHGGACRDQVVAELALKITLYASGFDGLCSYDRADAVRSVNGRHGPSEHVDPEFFAVMRFLASRTAAGCGWKIASRRPL